jgi:hypothetical protein
LAQTVSGAHRAVKPAGRKKAAWQQSRFLFVSLPDTHENRSDKKPNTQSVVIQDESNDQLIHPPAMGDLMYFGKKPLALLSLLSAGALTACGGGNHSAPIGGTLTGLDDGTSIVLQNNSADDLALSANQTFSFATEIAVGNSYYVSVKAQPIGESCVVTNGSGIVDSNGDSVANVGVTCAITSSVGGTVSGLATGGGLTLSLNGVPLPITSNGLFAFPGTLTPGSTYGAAVVTQPTGQTCTVVNSTGLVVTNAIANVFVGCVANPA